MAKKLAHEFVKNYYKDRGYTLCSKYVNNSTQDDLICPKGHKIKMVFHNFQYGKRCLECAGNQKLTQISVENYYKQFGYKLNSKYKNSINRDDLICPEGHSVKMTFNNFKSKGYRCQKCHFEKSVGENHPRFNPNREELPLNSRLREKHTNDWIIQNMSDDPNFMDWSINTDTYVVDHIIPVKLFCKLTIKYNLNEIEVKSIINKRKNLQLLTRKDNSSKHAKGSIKEAKQFLIEHGIQLED